MERYMDKHLWWALSTGREAKFLLNVYFEKEWETPMDELRQRLNITTPPETPMLKKWRDS